MTEDTKEELRLLRKILADKHDRTAAILGILGIVLGIAGIASLVVALLSDSRLRMIHTHTTKLIGDM